METAEPKNWTWEQDDPGLFFIYHLGVTLSMFMNHPVS